MKKIYAFNNKKNCRERQKGNFSVTLQNNQGNRFVPHQVKNLFQSIVLSPEEQLIQQDGQSLLQKRDNEEKVLSNRTLYLLRGETTGTHEIQKEGPSNSSQVSQNLQRTTPPDIVDEQVDRVINSINPASKLLQQLITPENLNIKTHLTYPCNFLIQLDVDAQGTLEFKKKLAILCFSFNSEYLQNVSTPQVVLAAFRALHFHKLFPNFKPSHLKLTPFLSVSTTGHKSFGIKTISVNDSDHCAENTTDFNPKNSSSNHLNFKESSNFLEDGATTNDKICLKPSTLKQKYFLVLNKNVNLVLNESKGENINSTPLWAPFFKSVPFDLVAKTFVQAASATLKTKKLEDLSVGAVFITVRIVALRVRKNYKVQNQQNGNKKGMDNYLKIITFFINQSTVFSSLAVAFFCFPLASFILEYFSSLFLLLFRIISTLLKQPGNFAVAFFRFLGCIPLFDTVFEIVYFQFILIISFFFAKNSYKFSCLCFFCNGNNKPCKNSLCCVCNH